MLTRMFARATARPTAFVRPARLAVLAAGLLALLLLPRPAFGQATGIITGTVVDGLNSYPLRNVQVVAHPSGDSVAVLAGVRSDASGRFTLPRLQPGRYLVTFRLLGYAPQDDGFAALGIDATSP